MLKGGNMMNEGRLWWVKDDVPGSDARSSPIQPRGWEKRVSFFFLLPRSPDSTLPAPGSALLLVRVCVWHARVLRLSYIQWSGLGENGEGMHVTDCHGLYVNASHAAGRRPQG